MLVRQLFSLAAAFMLFVWSCAKSTEKKSSKPLPDDISVLAALPLAVTAPANNPITDGKVMLGKLLFFDPILSGNKDVACASCHHPNFAFAESLEISIGVNGKGLGEKREFRIPNDIPFVKRNSQTIINTAFNGLTNETQTPPDVAPMFWDLRVKSLENQSLEPIKTFEEMRGHLYTQAEVLDKILDRIKKNSEYQRLFKAAFGAKNAITQENLAKAIATYERTIVANNSRFDQYMRGDNTALSQNEIDGMMLFLKSGCSKCHNGPMFSDYKIHTLGVEDNEKVGFSDDGFQKKYAFRTPTLRNLRFTAPYMHNGKLKTLQNVLEFYEDLSGGQIKNPKVKPRQLDPLIEHLKVNFKDISAIIEFLGTLNDDKFDRSIPTKVPSGLKVGGNI